MLQRFSGTDSLRGIHYSLIFSVIVCIGIIALETFLLQYELDPPQASLSHYEWQLLNPTFLSRATVWVGFALHQLAVWITIYYAQKNVGKYSSKLRPINIIAFGINTGFIILHYLQTAFFYDGMAQDIPSWTAQSAVIMMLFVILGMENRRRGLFFGKKMNFRKEFYRWLKEYHGYAFSFAVIYTFWFHPMVNTPGHLLGFVSTILVMFQGSLMFTKAHHNKWWTLLIEVIVLPHATLIAIGQGVDGLAHMFFFGFAFIFIVTQIHGLGLKPWVRYLSYIIFLGAIVFVYFFQREPFMMNEVIRVPAIEYILLFLTYGIWWLASRVMGRLPSLQAS